MARTCAVKGCGRPVDTYGWCHGHYLRWYRTGDVRAEVPLRPRRRLSCSVPGCDRGAHTRGMCRAHYARWRRYGDACADRPIRVATGRGGLSHGYLKVPVPLDRRHLAGGATSLTQHRLVMAISLGRALRPDESVHHCNGDRTDNRLANLELWSTAQPKGQRVTDKVTFALEMLARYAPHLLATTQESQGGTA